LREDDPEYNPQDATKDGIAKYLEYCDWEIFKKNIYNENNKVISFRASDEVRRRKIIPVRLVWFFGLTALVVWIGFFPPVDLYYKLQKKVIHFDARHLESDTYPHTVMITYDISKIKDKVYITFGKENEQKQLLTRDDQIITGCYYEPRIYHIQLFMNGRTIGHHIAKIYSDGWEKALIRVEEFFESDGTRRYRTLERIQVEDPIKTPGRLFIPRELAARNRVDTTGLYFTDYRLIRDFKLLTDSMAFEIRLRNNTKEGGIPCNTSILTLFAKFGRIRTIFQGIGCSAFSELSVSDVEMKGQHSDLSFFEADWSEYRNIKFKMENKKWQYFLDNDLMKEIEYSRPLGPFYGVRLKSRGSGSIDHVKIWNEKNQLVYEETFD
jgi:hypothetical protein